MKITNPYEQYLVTQKYLGYDITKGIVVETREGKKGIVLIVDNGEKVIPRFSAFKTIKIKDRHNDDKRISVFIKEAEKWHTISGYEYILPVLYIVQYKKRPLICMPYCDMDLRTYIEKRGQLDLIETLVFSTQILKALIYAKSKGINNHQDLKPENILLKDNSDKIYDFPPKGVHESVKFLVRVGDFGMANAYNEVSMPQGSYPYMAPEQYVPEEYTDFRPDIFSFGVIVFEMLTGEHPSGKKTKEIWGKWTRSQWKNWARDKSKSFKEDKSYTDLTKLIKKLLLTNPEDRPSEKQVLDELLHMLNECNEITARHLEVMFEYNDKLAKNDWIHDRIRSIEQLSQFPTQVNTLINEVKNEIDVLKEKKKNQKEIYYLCSLCREMAWLLLKRNKASDLDRAKFYSELLLSEIIELDGELINKNVFPNLIVKNFKIKEETYHQRDFELYAEIIGWGANLLEKIIGKNKTKNFFLNKDNLSKSAYYKHLATRVHSKDDLKAANMLDKCIEYNPQEPLFFYFKGLWLFHYYIKIDVLNKISEKERGKIKKEIIDNLDKAIKLDSKWQAPKNEKERLLKAWSL